jgi:hypothetical protein
MSSKANPTATITVSEVKFGKSTRMREKDQKSSAIEQTKELIRENSCEKLISAV